jgi:hypothetical protein
MEEYIKKIFDSPSKKIYEGKSGKMIVNGELNVDLIARYFLGLKQI